MCGGSFRKLAQPLICPCKKRNGLSTDDGWRAFASFLLALYENVGINNMAHEARKIGPMRYCIYTSRHFEIVEN